MGKVIKLILGLTVGLVALTLIGSVLYLGYLGFIPGVSSIFKSDKPVDLGVSYTRADYDSYNEKFDATVITTSTSSTPDESIKFSEPKDFDATVTQEEASARVAYAQWKYMPMSDTQVKFNADGTIEASGLLNIDNALPFLEAAGYSFSDENVQQATQYLEKLPGTPAVYIKAMPTVLNNTAMIDVQELKVGNLSIDLEAYDVDTALSDLANQIFQDIDGFYVESASFDDGTLHFVGSAPTRIEVENL